VTLTWYFNKTHSLKPIVCTRAKAENISDCYPKKMIGQAAKHYSESEY